MLGCPQAARVARTEAAVRLESEVVAAREAAETDAALREHLVGSASGSLDALRASMAPDEREAADGAPLPALFAALRGKLATGLSASISWAAGLGDGLGLRNATGAPT